MATKLSLIFIIVTIISSSISAQTNTWKKICTGASDVGSRNKCALVYLPDSNRFLISMGSMSIGTNLRRYPELSLRLPDERWINHLPNDTLYGKWADSLGNITTRGAANFSNLPYELLYAVEGYLRPNCWKPFAVAYSQYAYNSDDKCVYYYIRNQTFKYNTVTRRWHQLSSTVHPAGYVDAGAQFRQILWGSLCYDPHNKEILFFGGGNIDTRWGHAGTWVYKPSTNTWTKLDMTVEPPPRGLSKMVYDAKNNKIVLFGGTHLDFLTADTWIYDCATRTWSNANPSISPSPRAGHALVYLPKSERIVLLGGYGYSGGGFASKEPFEMWTYSVASNEWKLIKTYAVGVTRPTWIYSSMVACDTSDNIVALQDSGSYQAYKSTYLLSCDPTATDEAATLLRGVPAGTKAARIGDYDPLWYRNAIVPNPDSIETVLRNLPVNTWTRLTQPLMPPGERVWSTRVLVPELDRILIWGGGHSTYCGSDIPRFDIANNRWTIDYSPEDMLDYNGSGNNDGNSPALHTFNHRPFMPGHPRRAYCYSSLLKKMVATNYGPYTYFFDPVRMDWDTVHAIMPEGVKYYGATIGYCMQDTRKGVFLWKSSSSFYIMDTSFAWKQLVVKGSAIPRFYDTWDGCAYDSKRDRVLLFGQSTEEGQIWEYRFSDSTLAKLNPTGNPDTSRVWWRDAVYLPEHDKIIIQSDSPALFYNCAANSWELVPVSKNTTGVINSVSTGLMYDPKRDLVWNVYQKCETWVMRVAGGRDPVSLQENSISRDLENDISLSPNPFNPATQISVALKNNVNLNVTVHDLSGRLVREIVSGNFAKGKHSFIWNGTDKKGVKVSSGIYVFNVKHGKNMRIVKAMLCK